MAVVTEQIVLNAITEMIEDNKEAIKMILQRINSTLRHPKREPSQTDVVTCVEGNDFQENDTEGNKLKKVKVVYKQRYDNVPSVLASIQRLEINKGSEHRFEIRVEDVTAKDFTLVCSTPGNDTVIDYASVSYISVPKI